jgi:hypothetical protein
MYNFLFKRTLRFSLLQFLKSRFVTLPRWVCLKSISTFELLERFTRKLVLNLCQWSQPRDFLKLSLISNQTWRTRELVMWKEHLV